MFYFQVSSYFSSKCIKDIGRVINEVKVSESDELLIMENCLLYIYIYIVNMLIVPCSTSISSIAVAALIQNKPITKTGEVILLHLALLHSFTTGRTYLLILEDPHFDPLLEPKNKIKTPRAQKLKLGQTNSKFKIHIKNAFQRSCLKKFILDNPQVTLT